MPSGFDIALPQAYEDYVLPQIDKIVATVPGEPELRFGDGNANNIGTIASTPQAGDGDHHDWTGVGVVEITWPTDSVPTYNSPRVFDNPYFLELKGRQSDWYTLIATIEPQEAGYVICDRVSVNSTKNANNRTVNCTAIANAGYSFSNWDNACDTSVDCAVTLEATQIINVTFTQP